MWLAAPNWMPHLCERTLINSELVQARAAYLPVLVLPSEGDGAGVGAGAGAGGGTGAVGISAITGSAPCLM